MAIVISWKNVGLKDMFMNKADIVVITAPLNAWEFLLLLFIADVEFYMCMSNHCYRNDILFKADGKINI